MYWSCWLKISTALNPKKKRHAARLHIPVFGNLFFGPKKTFLPGFLSIFSFPVFSGGIFHRNVVLEVVAGIPVFCRSHRNFLQEFLWDRNSCVYYGFLRIPPDSSGFLRIPLDFCSRQTLSGSGQPTSFPPTSSPRSKLTVQICAPKHSKASQACCMCILFSAIPCLITIKSKH
jgi:hypothetical protein